MTVKFSDWEKLDLRVGKIIKAEQHPNADKLLVLLVDLGSEKRKLVAGLKSHYTAEKLVGKNCIVLANLEQKELRGIKSEGMILAADNGKGKIVLIKPESDIELGSKIR